MPISRLNAPNAANNGWNTVGEKYLARSTLVLGSISFTSIFSLFLCTCFSSSSFLVITVQCMSCSCSPFVSFSALKLALKVPLVVEYRDMLTDDPYTKSNAFKKLVNKAIEKHVINRASAVVSVSDPIIDDLVRKHGIEGDMKFTAIPSAFDPEDFEKVAPVDDGKKFVLALTTSLYGDRNPETIFSAISLLKKAGKVKPDNFSLDIYGYNPEKQHAPLLETLGITDVVHFKGFVPHSECISAMKGSTYNLDIGESKFDYPTIPYHFWEYIGSGKQVLHLGRRFDYKASFVRNNRLGIVLQIGRPMEAAVLLHTLMVDNERGLKRTVPAGFASKNTWDDRVEMLASVLQQVDGIAKFKPFSLPKPGGVVPGRYSFDDDYVAVYTG